jgi:hypothetical protein
MSGSMLADKLNEIVGEWNNLTIAGVKHRVAPLISEIEKSVDETLFKSFMIEFDCVRMECIYGDFEEDTEMVKNDFLADVKKVIKALG